MTKQQFFSWMIYDVLKAGAYNIVFKHVGGVVMVSYDLEGHRLVETIAKTTSPVRVARYQGWFKGLMDGYMDTLHAEALAIDSQMHQDEFNRSSTAMRGVWTNLNHAEALRMNAELDEALADIARNVPTDTDRTRFEAIARWHTVGGGIDGARFPKAVFDGYVRDEHGETLAQFSNIVL